MNEELTPLEALEKIDHTICLAFNENNNALFNKDKYEHIDCKDIDEFIDCHDIIKKELKELDKIKARLVVVNMKINSKREECVANMQHTDEDDFVHEASKIEMDCLDWFREMLQEVLL